MIEVGEYIRTKTGQIDKVINNQYYMSAYIECKNDVIWRNSILKHSKNIINLIEVGDIVEIYDVLNEDVIYIWGEEMLKAVKTDVSNGIMIRRILTKEQYEANCYKIN